MMNAPVVVDTSTKIVAVKINNIWVRKVLLDDYKIQLNALGNKSEELRRSL